MLHIQQPANSLDSDESECLNKIESAAIVLNQTSNLQNQSFNKESRYSSNSLIENRILDYLIVTGLIFTVLLVAHYENNSPLTITSKKTLAENKQGIGHTNNNHVNKPKVLQESLQMKKNQNNSLLPLQTQKVQLLQQNLNTKKENVTPHFEDKHITQQKQQSNPIKFQTLEPTNDALLGGLTSTTITQVQKENAQRWMSLKDENIYQNTKLAEQQRTYYQTKYKISAYEELPICIVIPSYNNVKDNRHIDNIKSVVMQEYTNYHIVFIDDASIDGTGEQVEAFLQNQNKISKEKYIVIKNKQQKMAMPNLRMAAKEYCQPQEIFIIVDGDDWLIGRQVLKVFNSVFQSKKAWFVYTNFLTIRGTVGYSRYFPQSIIDNNRYRVYPFVTSHLRAFYTQLFLNINEKDLKNDAGEYLKAANDVAICIPILEMSHQKVFYVQELTYYYNSNTGQNNHQIRQKQQKSNDRMLRRRKRYEPLKQLQFISKSKNVTENSQKGSNQHKNLRNAIN